MARRKRSAALANTCSPDAPMVYTPQRLRRELWVQSATSAVRIEPRNYGRANCLRMIAPRYL